MKKFTIFFILTVLVFSFNQKIANCEESLTPIMGSGSLSEKQMFCYLKENNDKNGENPLSDEYIIQFVKSVIKQSKKEGVNHDIAFALMMHETGFLNFGGDVIPSQNNFGGLGTTGGGVKGASFDTKEEGILAVVQHLKCYASKEELNEKCVDPRWNETLREKAIYVEYLGYADNPYKKGWAKPGKGYGKRLLNHIERAKNVNTKGTILPEEKKKSNSEIPVITVILILILGLFIKKFKMNTSFPNSKHRNRQTQNSVKLRKNRRKF